MREILSTAFAATIVLSTGMFGHSAEATTLAAPAALNAAIAPAALIRQAANLCGTNGCALVQTKRVRHQKPGSVAAQHI